MVSLFAPTVVYYKILKGWSTGKNSNAQVNNWEFLPEV